MTRAKHTDKFRIEAVKKEQLASMIKIANNNFQNLME